MRKGGGEQGVVGVRVPMPAPACRGAAQALHRVTGVLPEQVRAVRVRERDAQLRLRFADLRLGQRRRRAGTLLHGGRAERVKAPPPGNASCFRYPVGRHTDEVRPSDPSGLRRDVGTLRQVPKV